MSEFEEYWKNINTLKYEIRNAEAILIGVGSGLSTAAGMTYGGKRFYDNFSDFAAKYGVTDMYSAGFYPFETLEEYWAYWSRHIYFNRYDDAINRKPYEDLLEIVKDKEYFVLTTNVDHCFQIAGFDKNRLFYTQGDYGLWQCSKPCSQVTYDNEEAVVQMIAKQKEMKIPSELIPYCPKCGAPLTMNLRADDTFVEDEGWKKAAIRYTEFVNKFKDSHILYLELGVGYNTPGIIKYPFWNSTYKNEDAVYACINYDDVRCPVEIQKQSICIEEDLAKVLKDLK